MATTAPDLGPGTRRPVRGARAGERRGVRTSRPGYAALRAVGLALGSVLVVGSAISTLPSIVQQERVRTLELPAQLTQLTIKASQGEVVLTELAPAPASSPAAGEAASPAAPQARVDSTWTFTEPTLTLIPSGDGEATLEARCTGACTTDLAVQVPAGVPVQIQTSYGDVDVTSTGTVDVRATAGNILVRGQPTAVAASTTYGDIEVDSGRAPNTLTASSSYGDIDVELPADERYAVTTRTAHGNEQVDLPTDPSARHTVSIRTSYGDINLAPRR